MHPTRPQMVRTIPLVAAATLLLFLAAGALSSPSASAASASEPFVCEGEPFPPSGYVVGATPPGQRYLSDGVDPYILARGVLGDMRIVVGIPRDDGTCAAICDSPLAPLHGLTCPVRILFPAPQPVFVQVTGIGVFVVCEAQQVPQFPC